MGKKSQQKKANKTKKTNNKSDDKTKKLKKERAKPKSISQFQTMFKTEARDIKNKQKRQQVHFQRKATKNLLKMRQRKQRKKLPASQRQKPITIQDKQVAEEEFLQDYNEECLDQFNKFLNNQEPVKVLITTSLKPHKKIYGFIRQLMMVFHNIAYYPRRDMKLNEVYQYAKQLGFTHVIVIRQTHGWQLLIRCIDGPLAIFKVTSVVYQKDIHHYGLATDHYPQLILNNFDSRVGVRVGRLLASLFPQNPQFKGRRVVTFHNQRDFIFFRHHRYIFKQGFDGVNMQEIGPRFTMQLKKFYSGDEQAVKGLEFEAKDNMYVDRKAVYL